MAITIKNLHKFMKYSFHYRFCSEFVTLNCNELKPLKYNKTLFTKKLKLQKPCMRLYCIKKK